jgi:hypothetical protein
MVLYHVTHYTMYRLLLVYMCICSYVHMFKLIYARVVSSWYNGVLSTHILHMTNVYVRV